MIHLLVCFIKGFGLLIGIIIGGLLISTGAYHLCKWACSKTSLDEDYYAPITIGLLVFVAIGTVISLAFCGILK